MRRLLPLALALTAAEPVEDPCPTVPPFGYALVVGNARGKNEAEAIAEARAAAKELLSADVCRGVSELRCTSIRKNIAPWGAGRFDRKAQSACAAVAVKRELLDSFERDVAKLDADVTALVPALAPRLAGATLEIAAPSWASGCSAGDIGASLVGVLRKGLATLPDVRVLAAGDSDPAATRLRFTLAPGRELVRVDAALRRAGENSEMPIGGFEFSSDLFALAVDEVGQCRTDLALGFAGSRAGAGGLQVEVEVPTVDGRLCEGAQFNPLIRTNQDAHVEVWSVAQDGTAYLIFPAPGAPDHGVGVRDLGSTQAVRIAGYAGDESLVAVATPGAAPAAERTGFCKLSGPFSLAIAAPGAALSRATYEVIPAGTEGCGPLAGADRGALEATLAQAPLCR